MEFLKEALSSCSQFVMLLLKSYMLSGKVSVHCQFDRMWGNLRAGPPGLLVGVILIDGAGGDGAGPTGGDGARPL